MTYYNHFAVAIEPQSLVFHSTRNFKQQLKSGSGWYPSVNSEPHITLVKFTNENQDLEKILNKLRWILSQLNPLDIHYRDFDTFKNQTFYIKLLQHSSQNIMAYVRFIARHIKPYKFTYKCNNPHLTIGSNLTDEQLRYASQNFTSFIAGEHCDAFVIRRFNPERKQYDIIESIPLSGNIHPKHGQLPLF
jgi:2'-5' RNA ligase